ncbi:unnamed protein product [Trichobilharzia szidati]|nr:unnamed protein product [Trichobilharzia szidati]
MRCFVLFISFSILLHVQQSTQDDLRYIKHKLSWIKKRLTRNAESLKENNATMADLTKVIPNQIEDVNIRLSPGQLSIDKYIACKIKQIEGRIGISLMQDLVETIQTEEKNFGFIPADIAKMKQCFQNKTKKYEEMAKTYDQNSCARDNSYAVISEAHPVGNQIHRLYYQIAEQAKSTCK